MTGKRYKETRRHWGAAVGPSLTRVQPVGFADQGLRLVIRRGNGEGRRMLASPIQKSCVIPKDTFRFRIGLRDLPGAPQNPGKCHFSGLTSSSL